METAVSTDVELGVQLRNTAGHTGSVWSVFSYLMLSAVPTKSSPSRMWVAHFIRWETEINEGGEWEEFLRLKDSMRCVHLTIQVHIT